MNIIYTISVFLVIFSIMLTGIKYLLNFFQSPYCIPPSSKEVHSRPIIFSVHIPTRAEPFEVVKKCIDSVKSQIRSQDEIIVLDNNHDCEEDYIELKNYCEAEGIIFRHYDHIPGYKAGAMNKAVELSKPEATHYIVIDCDYILEKNAIARILDNLKVYSTYDFLQFPQAYFDKKIDIINELNKYFNYNLSLPLTKKNTLGTGTLCVIDKNILEKIGGWPTNSITEDAQFGINIQKIGGRGIFINEEIGKGMTPPGIKDYLVQRKRWIYGNAQVLFYLFRHYNKETFRRSNICQLSTWLNFTPITVVIHIFYLILFLFNISNDTQIFYLIYAHYIILLIFKIIEFSKLKISFSRKMRALSINWGTFWISTFYWVPALFGLSRGFVRTPKTEALNSDFFKLPMLFLLLHILTLFIVDLSIVGFIVIGVFIALEVFSKYIFIQNFKV